MLFNYHRHLYQVKDGCLGTNCDFETCPLKHNNPSSQTQVMQFLKEIRTLSVLFCHRGAPLLHFCSLNQSCELHEEIQKEMQFNHLKPKIPHEYELGSRQTNCVMKDKKHIHRNSLQVHYSEVCDTITCCTAMLNVLQSLCINLSILVKSETNVFIHQTACTCSCSDSLIRLSKLKQESCGCLWVFELQEKNNFFPVCLCLFVASFSFIFYYFFQLLLASLA